MINKNFVGDAVQKYIDELLAEQKSEKRKMK